MRHPAALGLLIPLEFPHEFHHVAPFHDRVFSRECVRVPVQPLDPGAIGAQEVFDASPVPVRTEEDAVIAASVTGTVSARASR